ncbi:MAG: hypothetical protein M0P46_03275 [Thiopseudomonas sp.]|nr:hypothetical protein [Thiopseudomonas sp.]
MRPFLLVILISSESGLLAWCYPCCHCMTAVLTGRSYWLIPTQVTFGSGHH